MECIEVNWSCKHMKKARSGQTAIDINSITTLWRKPPYQRTVRKLRANERVCCSFLAYWALLILMFLNYICEIFWLAFLHLFLNLAYYQFAFQKIFSLVTFLIAVSLKEKSGNGSLKPRDFAIFWAYHLLLFFGFCLKNSFEWKLKRLH